MSNNVIAAVALNDNEFVIWFEGGLSKRYDKSSVGLGTSSLDTLHVLTSSEGIGTADAKIMADELAAQGEEIDFVNDEKQRLLKSLSVIRKDASFSQTRLGEAAGIRQSVISRIEGCEISPQINTLLKLLAPLGKTLAIVDLEDK